MDPSTTPPEKPRIKIHRCPKCVMGYVIPTSKDGRFFPYKESTLINLPMSVYIPTCTECKAAFPTPEVQEEIKRALEAEYKRHEPDVAKALERLRRRKGIN